MLRGPAPVGGEAGFDADFAELLGADAVLLEVGLEFAEGLLDISRGDVGEAFVGGRGLRLELGEGPEAGSGSGTDVILVWEIGERDAWECDQEAGFGALRGVLCYENGAPGELPSSVLDLLLDFSFVGQYVCFGSVGHGGDCVRKCVDFDELEWRDSGNTGNTEVGAQFRDACGELGLLFLTTPRSRNARTAVELLMHAGRCCLTFSCLSRRHIREELDKMKPESKTTLPKKVFDLQALLAAVASKAMLE